MGEGGGEQRGQELDVKGGRGIKAARAWAQQMCPPPPSPECRLGVLAHRRRALEHAALLRGCDHGV